ncbi:unnamed protein product [Cuscuta epithymum]|uniref:AIG1-type G domain-containing protein n=1 Tax=Cuscuta epithymum TaxID=186058 RepID=A0AAV0DDF2_9ASTE|nr:unnamed protein product [Cuscuta epithymum]CAH9132652.1 unnamed protein product [Cuscuta epithymum]
MDPKEAALPSSSDVSDMKVAVDNSNSHDVVSDDDEIFLNAQEEPVGEEPVGSGIGGSNLAEPFEDSPAFDVLVNGDDENLNKGGVLDKDEAFLEKEHRDREEPDSSDDSLDNGSVTEVQPSGGLEGSLTIDGGKVSTDENLNEFVNPVSEGRWETHEVEVDDRDMVEADMSGALTDETVLEAPPGKIIPDQEVSLNDDVNYMNKVEDLEGEKVIVRDGALLFEEKEEESGESGSIIDNGFPNSAMHVTEINGLTGYASEVKPDGLEGNVSSIDNSLPDSAMHVTEINGLNGYASEVQPDDMEGSGVSCGDNNISTDEFVNLMSEGVGQEKVEEVEAVGGTAIVVEEIKDVKKQEGEEDVASMNETDKIKSIDSSSEGLALTVEERENSLHQEWVPYNGESAASINIAEAKPLMEFAGNMPVSVTKSDIISLDVPEDVMEKVKECNHMETEKLSDIATTQNASSDTVHSNDMEGSTNKYSSKLNTLEIPECEENNEISGDAELADGSVSDQESDGMIFGSSEAARQFIEELERESGRVEASSLEPRIDGQVMTDSDEEGEEEEVDTDEEGGDRKQMLHSSALAALLKAATGGADRDGGGNITMTSQDGSRLFSVERPAGLGSSLRSLGPTASTQPNNRSLLFTPTLSNTSDAEENLSEEEKKKLEKLQEIRVKFLRLVKRLGFSPDESIATQVLYRLSLIAGKQNSKLFSIDTAKSTALQLETEMKDEDGLDFSVNILVLGKSGVGKSATINSILGEEKTPIDAFSPMTTDVREICVIMDGVKVRVFDTPGLKSAAMEQAFNNKVLSNVKKLTKKNPVDIVLYVDRLDSQTRDLNDLPLLRTITASLGSAIWRSTIVTLTHAASAPPDGPSGSPLSYEVFVTQRSRVVQQSIGHAVGDLHMMSPSMMNPVSLVENHPACRRNRDGQRILPNGQIWKPQLLLLCYSMKILSEASSLSKPQDPFDHRKLFGFRVRSPPLPYMLSSMLQSRPHPKLTSELGGDNVDSDIDLDDLSDSDQEGGGEEEYDQLPPFKPLRRAQIAKLSKEQKRAYFEEYDYRVKLLQKKQWREELRRMREMKKKGKGAEAPPDDDFDSGAAAPVAVPLPDMVLPPSFDSDNPTYRYRFLEPTSQFLARPVLDTHGWDHDCGYEGVNIEHSQAITDRFPAAITFQISKDKKDFSVSLDSSVSAKHGENGSSMAGFDIQNIGKQLAYVVRGETKFKNLKKNKTAAGVSVTFIGENVVTGIKVEDQVTLGKRYVLVGSTGTVRSKSETAYGANFEVKRREADYPIGQVQSTLSMSVIKWRGDLALGLNALAQFSAGRNSKVAVRAGINNKMSGQVSVRTSSSDNLSIALTAILPVALAIYRKLYPGVAEKYSFY